jgi:hypothetical protein
MFFTVVQKNGSLNKWAGTPVFKGELLPIGPEWDNVTVHARGVPQADGGPVHVENQGAHSAGPAQAADPASTDMYCIVELPGDDEDKVHRGTPIWNGHQLEINGNVYRPDQWAKVTVFRTGWAAREESESEDDASDG